MNRKKLLIPSLITFALLSLTVLQAIWLYSVYQLKEQELNEKTRISILKTGERLQRKEDSKFIIKNLDSVLLSDEHINSEAKESIRIIISEIKGNSDSVKLKKKHLVLKKDSFETTTVIRVKDSSKSKVIIKTTNHSSMGVLNKADELQHLFLKMALESRHGERNFSSLIQLKEVNKILKEELNKLGVDLTPSFRVFFLQNKSFDSSLSKSEVCKSSEFDPNLKAIITAPLLTEEFNNGQLNMTVGFKNTNNFLLKKMSGLLILSLIITTIIGSVMIYIFRRLLDQEKLHQVKTDFINNMTHELKTPIATISLAVEAIQKPTVQDDKKMLNEYAQILKEENNRLNTHVERVLQLALLERTRDTVSLEKVNLVAVMNEVLRSLHLQIESKEAKIQYEYSHDEIILQAEPHHLYGILTNLLENALKYSAKFCKIEIRVNKSEDQIEIRVRDNGVGIDNEFKDKVFEPFFRVQHGDLHDVKGTGLGLSYVRSALKEYNASIELQSEKGIGTEFIIRFKV